MPVTPQQQAEIDELRAAAVPTLRAVSPGMEAHLYKAAPVLDHGFVRVIDYMGDDAAICQAARVSYGKGTKSVQTARLRGPPMDSPPHGQRQRIFGPLFHSGS